MSSVTTGSELDRVFARAADCGRAAFIAYLMAGDPDRSTTLATLAAVGAAGADLIELGLPYGDPVADGPTIAGAARRALDGGTRLRDVFDLLARHSHAGGAPVVLFTYFNPIYKYGIEHFTRDARAAGAIGIIVPDLALEESFALREAAAGQGLQMPLLVAPSTPPARAAKIAANASGFVYVVSRAGVTGVDEQANRSRLQAQLATLRESTAKPLAVGFGIGSPGAVREVASVADGVIVGSALIESYAGRSGDEAAAEVGSLVKRLVAAAVKESAYHA